MDALNTRVRDDGDDFDVIGALVDAMIPGLWFIGFAVLAALTGFAVIRSVHRGRLRPACARPPARRKRLKYGHSV